MHVYYRVYGYVSKKKISLSLQELCILIIGILHLLTLSSHDSREFKRNPFFCQAGSEVAVSTKTYAQVWL